MPTTPLPFLVDAPILASTRTTPRKVPVDIVHFHVPLNGAVGPFRVITSLYYQSVPPNWLDEMFTLNSAEIDSPAHVPRMPTRPRRSCCATASG